MSGTVKRSSPLREARKADTEQRIIEAATTRFLADGYAGTTLAAVAAEAGVGERTVYVRFGNKAELLKRVVDVAVVGDTEARPLAGRAWYQRVMAAPTLAERVAAYADGAAAMMRRLGPAVAVAQQAEHTEPLIADAAAAGRAGSHAEVAAVWTAMHADGLLHPDADLAWIITTVATLTAADTYVLMTTMLGTTPETYRDWMYDTWMHFATNPRPAAEPR
ncbi:TetR/AcrR family transcriptional regulator [Nocardia asteroides]|uniref:TetR/AcrR family transcriptional regulator n=1 Tax=Nocardia asteroides TaxID=1824 RepID=UPI001E45ED5F|nr:TetR/AcrR family transcriptional regulator [Nocardia asteroides]UGT63080.1 TetR/AcrR family transcriptional regulator [Nocardia asteroides]